MTTSTLSRSRRPHARRRPQRRYSERPTWRTVVLAVAAYVTGFLFIFPYLDMIITSLRPQSELQSSAVLPRRFEFSAYRALLSSGLLHNLVITIVIAGGATILVLLVAMPAAYYTARFKFRGRILFLVLVLITQMLQPASLLVGIYRQYYVLGALNTVWSLILVNAGFNMAFAVWILTAYFASIPKDLEEAAMVDGATRLGALRRITLPLAGPGVVTALIFTFIAAWNEFLVALTLTSTPNKQPLTVAINNFLGAYSIAWQNLFAASVVATIPVIVLFAVIERRLVRGLTAGSIK
jgi:multiple sugar transport system permease protein